MTCDVRCTDNKITCEFATVSEIAKDRRVKDKKRGEGEGGKGQRKREREEKSETETDGEGEWGNQGVPHS